MRNGLLKKRRPRQFLFAAEFSRLYGRCVGGRRVGDVDRGGTIAVATRGEPAGCAPQAGRSPLIWANLLHLSYNMWCDRPLQPQGTARKEDAPINTYQPYLRCDDKLWEELTTRMAEVGMNMVVIDLGDGVAVSESSGDCGPRRLVAAAAANGAGPAAQAGLGADSEA